MDVNIRDLGKTPYGNTEHLWLSATLMEIRGENELALGGATILLVEDDFFIGLEYVELLTGWGAKVIGPAISDSEARKLLAGIEIDAALLDVSIQGGNSFAIAQDLYDEHIPFAFVTAFASDEAMFPAGLKSLTRLGKPVHEAQLLSVLKSLLSTG